MNKDEIRKQRDALVKQAHANIVQAEELSDKIQEGFNWELAYGMGGYYEAAGEYDSSDYDSSDATSGSWVPSSHSC